MPHLDANALDTDRDGLAFLLSVLSEPHAAEAQTGIAAIMPCSDSLTAAQHEGVRPSYQSVEARLPTASQAVGFEIA